MKRWLKIILMTAMTVACVAVWPFGGLALISPLLRNFRLGPVYITDELLHRRAKLNAVFYEDAVRVVAIAIYLGVLALWMMVLMYFVGASTSAWLCAVVICGLSFFVALRIILLIGSDMAEVHASLMGMAAPTVNM